MYNNYYTFFIFFLFLYIEGEKLNAKPLRILTIDGGGIRGLVPIEVLRVIEQSTEKPIHELFDVFAGTSTGGILAVALGLFHMTLDECEEMYFNLGKKVFEKHTVVQWFDLLTKGAKFPTETLEEIFKEIIKNKTGNENILLNDKLITSDKTKNPKVMLLSATFGNNQPDTYVFRNYKPKGKEIYLGNHKTNLWKALRATTAAATYFEPIELEPGAWFTDGGLLANNPTQVVLRELKFIFDNTASEIDYIVSIGTGKIAWKSNIPNLVNIVEKLTNIVTNSERTHFDLSDRFYYHDILKKKYWSFIPNKEENNLAETLDVKLKTLQQKTTSYMLHPEIKKRC